MPSQSLPSHLSYKAALVLLPPSNITPPIQTLRKSHDRNFHRWPPHINLIYPFIASPSTRIDDILPRIKSAIRSVTTPESRWPVSLKLNQPCHFRHSKDSSTVYLTSRDDLEHQIGIDIIKTLQNALQLEFAECDADTRPFVPHLSIGQAKRTKDVVALKGDIQTVMASYCQTDDWSLDWLVDAVVVLEREGYSEPFEVVSAVLLEENDE